MLKNIALITLIALTVSACQTKTAQTPATVGSNDHEVHEMTMEVTDDKHFLEMMIPHHEEAINTSNFIVANSKNEELIAFAQEVVIAQQSEVDQMQLWYKLWYGSAYVVNNLYSPMMSELEKLDGEELDQTYIREMIEHHQGAVTMAESIKDTTTKSEIEQLAENIIETQTKEIVLLKSWVK